MKQKYCSNCLNPINESREKYVMFIVKLGNKIKEFKCFHVLCWRKHFENVLKAYNKNKSIW